MVHSKPLDRTILFHGQRIAHVISHDETGDPIGNSREVRCRRKNDEPFHCCAIHCPSSGKRAVVKHRAWFENFARPESRNDCVVILHRVKQLIFIQDISFENGEPFTFGGDIFRASEQTQSPDDLARGLSERFPGQSGQSLQ